MTKEIPVLSKSDIRQITAYAKEELTDFPDVVGPCVLSIMHMFDTDGQLDRTKVNMRHLAEAYALGYLYGFDNSLDDEDWRDDDDSI